MELYEIDSLFDWLSDKNNYSLKKDGYLFTLISYPESKLLLDYIFYLQQRVRKTIQYCEESSKTIKSEYFSDVLKILKGEENEK